MRNPSTAQDIPYTTGENASLEATYEESKLYAGDGGDGGVVQFGSYP